MGYIHGKIKASEEAGGGEIPFYFRYTLCFRAPKGPHEWLNRSVIIGTAERRRKVKDDDPEDHSLFRYYVIR